jgi:hypothetical protein
MSLPLLCSVQSQVQRCATPALRSTFCTENRIYVIPEKELCGLSPNFYNHVSVSDLYIPKIGPHIWLQQNRQTDPGNTVYM